MVAKMLPLLNQIARDNEAVQTTLSWLDENRLDAPEVLKQHGIAVRSEFVREFLNALRDGYHAAVDDTKRQSLLPVAETLVPSSANEAVASTPLGGSGKPQNNPRSGGTWPTKGKGNRKRVRPTHITPGNGGESIQSISPLQLNQACSATPPAFGASDWPSLGGEFSSPLASAPTKKGPQYPPSTPTTPAPALTATPGSANAWATPPLILPPAPSSHTKEGTTPFLTPDTSEKAPLPNEKHPLMGVRQQQLLERRLSQPGEAVEVGNITFGFQAVNPNDTPLQPKRIAPTAAAKSSDLSCAYTANVRESVGTEPPGKKENNNSSSPITPQPPPDAIPALDSLSTVYGRLISRVAVPNAAAELCLLLRLLTGEMRTTKPEQGYAFPVVFDTTANASYFAAAALSASFGLVSALDTQTQRLLATHTRFVANQPTRAAELNDATRNIREQHPDPDIRPTSSLLNISMSFKPDTDKSQSEPPHVFHNREKCRDIFQGLIREWESEAPGAGAAEDEFVRTMEGKINSLMRELQRPNYGWFAGLYVHLLLKLVAGAAKASPDTTDPLLLLRRMDPGKLQKLNKRMSVSGHRTAANDSLLLHWTPTHTEQFFSLMITSVDSHMLCTHVTLALANAITALGDNFSYTGATNVSEVGERLVRLCGLVTFYPYVDQSSASLHGRLSLPGLRNQVYDITPHLDYAETQDKITMTVLWVCQYLLMSRGSDGAPPVHIQQHLKPVFDRLLGLQCKLSPIASRHRQVALTTMILGCTFEALSLDSLAQLDATNRPSDDQFTGDMHSILQEGQSGVAATTTVQRVAVRKIKPIENARAEPMQGNVTARELEHWFFASNPRLKQTVDFVTERVAPEIAARVHALFTEALSFSLQSVAESAVDVIEEYASAGDIDRTAVGDVLVERFRGDVVVAISRTKEILLAEVREQSRSYGSSKVKKVIALLAESDLNARTVELATELCMDRVHRLVVEKVSFKMETELPALAQSIFKDCIKDHLGRVQSNKPGSGTSRTSRSAFYIASPKPARPGEGKQSHPLVDEERREKAPLDLTWPADFQLAVATPNPLALRTVLRQACTSLLEGAMQGQEALSSVSQELAKTEALTAWELQQISRLCSDSLVLSNACEPYGDSLVADVCKVLSMAQEKAEVGLTLDVYSELLDLHRLLPHMLSCAELPERLSKACVAIAHAVPSIAGLDELMARAAEFPDQVTSPCMTLGLDDAHRELARQRVQTFCKGLFLDGADSQRDRCPNTDSSTAERPGHSQ